MIHHAVWYWLDELNDALVPGPGQLIGFDVKRDFFNPIDLIPVVGPLGKLYKATKIVKHGPKVKRFFLWGLNLAADVYAVKESVEWYNAHYRSASEESSSPSRSGNADVKISGGGGTKKGKLTASQRRRGKSIQKSLFGGRPCGARGRYGKRCYLKKGHNGRHRYQ